MMPKTETSGDNAAEEWSTSVNWEEDSAIKAEREEAPNLISGRDPGWPRSSSGADNK